MRDVHNKQSSPKLIDLLRNYLVGMVIGVAVLITVFGYIGLEKVYESADQNLRQAIRDRYKAEIQHVVETVAAAIESTVPGEIGPRLGPDQQEEVQRIIRGAKFDRDETSDQENGYFFLYDMEGRCIAHGIDRDQEGQILLELRDEDDVPLIKELRDRSKDPRGGFVEYKWRKPSQDRASPKISYAKSLRGEQWWLGAGVYEDKIGQTLQAELNKQRDQKFGAMGIAALGVLSLLAGAYFSPRLAKRVTRPIDALVEGAQRVSQGDYIHPVMLENGTEETQVLGNVFNRMQEKIIAQISELSMALGRIRELTSNEWEKVEEERRRLSRDLHADLGEKLSVLRLVLDEVLRAKDLAERETRGEAAVQIILKMTDSLREILHSLRPRLLTEFGLAKGLTAFLKPLAQAANIDLCLHLQDDERRLSPQLEIGIFRIVQEAAINVIRHAKAHRMDVSVQALEGRLDVSVQDDGCGMNVKTSMLSPEGRVSFGLLNMQERAASLGGTIQFDSVPTGGTRVQISIPHGSIRG